MQYLQARHHHYIGGSTPVVKQSTEYDRTRIRAFNTVKEDINEEEECKDDSSKQERRKIPQNSINDQVVENEEEEIEES